MSLFNPSLASAPLPEMETRRALLPIGEVLAQVTKMDFKTGTVSKGENAGKPWDRVDFGLEITDPEYLRNYADGTATKAVTTYGIMLELAADRQSIAVGQNKNIKLGRFRAACGTNGKPLDACVGQMVRVMIGHKPHPTEVDENEQPIMLDEVTGVAAA